jgi:short-subunit dehydrogenase
MNLDGEQIVTTKRDVFNQSFGKCHQGRAGSDDMTEIARKNILITGGASGIGRQMALKMAKEGGNLILWDINEANLEKVKREIQDATGREAHGYLCDVSDREQVYAVAEKVKADVGPVDILVNNAGIVSGQPLLDLPDEKIEATFKVNVLALFWVTKAFLPHMVERNAGHIVNIASSAGFVGVSKLTDYSSSKFAAVGFDESLRNELRSVAPNVRTTVVCPAFIDTGMFKGAKTRFSSLLPILKEAEVADAVVKAVKAGRARLMMPAMVYLVPSLRLLPIKVFDALGDILGVNVSMDEFVGRAKAGG